MLLSPNPVIIILMFKFFKEGLVFWSPPSVQTPLMRFTQTTTAFLIFISFPHTIFYTKSAAELYPHRDSQI